MHHAGFNPSRMHVATTWNPLFSLCCVRPLCAAHMENRPLSMRAIRNSSEWPKRMPCTSCPELYASLGVAEPGHI